MSNTKIIKALTQLETKEKVLEITQKLLEHNLQYTLMVKNIVTANFITIPCYKFIAVQDIHNVKYFVPEFEIKQDERKRQYAELVINYE